MTPRDRDLGMDRRISRRDFLHGMSACVLGAAIPQGVAADSDRRRAAPLYPPARTGMRGSHAGSFEVAHALALEGRRDWGRPQADADGDYDLVVVGGGVSGLAAAWFYRQQLPRARVLILENHDDFGGHAKRNEFRHRGRTVIGYGGSQSFEAPGSYSEVSKTLLRDLGIDLQRFYRYYDQEFFRRHGLGAGVYFDEDTFGAERLVMKDLLGIGSFIPLAPDHLSIEQAAAMMPLSASGRRQLVGLLANAGGVQAENAVLRDPAALLRISYRDVLIKHLGVDDQSVLTLFQHMGSGYFGIGIDAVPALWAFEFGFPGLGDAGFARLQSREERAVDLGAEPYIFHFPDGNASVARLLVRRLIPGVAAGDSMEDVVTAAFDYNRLDSEDAAVRLRLNSTVIGVSHHGDPATAKAVELRYVQAGRAHRVRARDCVLACYNMMIPYLCPELPEAQQAALSSLVKVPLVYTNVLLDNWRAWEKLGLACVYAPGCYHHNVYLDFPVSMGSYAFSRSADEPVIVHLSRVPAAPGLPARDQHRAGRLEMLETRFETIERDIRLQFAGMLSGGGFDPATDIAGITVNRWPHGYAYDHNPLFDPDYAEDEYPYVRGRRRFGRIAIANSDAGGEAYLWAAIDQAHRAVQELFEGRSNG